MHKILRGIRRFRHDIFPKRREDFERLADKLHDSGRSLLLCGMRDQPARMMRRAEFHEHIGTENLVSSVKAALDRARALLA